MPSPKEAVRLEEFAPTQDRMPAFLTRFRADRDALERRWLATYSAQRRERMQRFFTTWQAALDALPYDELTHEDRVDWHLCRNLLDMERRRLEREAKQFAEIEPLLPFAVALQTLEEDRRDFKDIEPEKVAALLDALLQETQALRESVQKRFEAGERDAELRPVLANRAAHAIDRLAPMLEDWFTFYFGYDPLFAWWVEHPYQAFLAELTTYATYLREKVAGTADKETILGDPIGRDALLEDLAFALIPYTPEELIALANAEWAWCRAEMRRAAEEMGFGEDARAALEQVKNRHVAPGQQPALVRDLAFEATRYVQENDLVTVPPLAEEVWRMEMMSPEMQKVNPFFLGGEEIIVSFPTDAMEHRRKRMSLRGNNPHFSRATVQHELIPGHHLQMFSMERYRPYRQIFETPFWIEGWTLHWEMLLWERGFAVTPEDRIGMLFWRMHRCARVLFSLGFHLREKTPEECVEMLVEEVGHERENAVAEVRRSCGSDYPPLYQCAYLIGGMQVHALYRECTGSGSLTDRAFHDAMLHANCMPIPMLRALLTEDAIPRDFRSDWRFASTLLPAEE